MINKFVVPKQRKTNPLLFNDTIPKETPKGTMSWFIDLILSMRNFICTVSVWFLLGFHIV